MAIAWPTHWPTVRQTRSTHTGAGPRELVLCACADPEHTSRMAVITFHGHGDDVDVTYNATTVIKSFTADSTALLEAIEARPVIFDKAWALLGLCPDGVAPA